MGEELKEKPPVRVIDATKLHLRRFFECKDLPPGTTKTGGPWRPTEPWHPLKEK